MVYDMVYAGRFSETFDGVVLAYEVDVQSKKAKILSGIYPYLGVKLQAKLLLFNPKPGMLLGSSALTLSCILWSHRYIT